MSVEKDIHDLIGAGKEISLETVDFDNPNRPKTCLEVDFPIIPINKIAIIEGNAGKPIYQMSKWWARRRSSVFRALLLAAATKAPEEPLETSKVIWASYYKNHQKNEKFKNLKVTDIFMGGGTTVVEGLRLGMQMTGNDLNPVAWMVVKNETSKVNIEEIKSILIDVETKVKPQIQPYSSCNCPRGHKGKWLKFKSRNVPIKPFLDNLKMIEPSAKEQKEFGDIISTFEGWSNWYLDHGYEFTVMGDEFQPLSLTNEERDYYRYWGPEVIYTFWVKHGQCQVSGCNHRTPIMNSPIISVKTMSVKAWLQHKCLKCGNSYDVEEKEARMAPSANFIVSESEIKYTTINKNLKFYCPCCGLEESKSILDLKKAKNKKVDLTLLIDPIWLRGLDSNDENIVEFGGRSEDNYDSTYKWNEERNKKLKFIEVRGKLPVEIKLSESGVIFKTDNESGANKGSGKFVCASCGTKQQFIQGIENTGKDSPISIYAIHGYCPECDSDKELYNGRFFDIPNEGSSYDVANQEWILRKTKDLKGYWPESEIEFSHQTHQRDNLPSHGYRYWWNMFNSRQLLVLSQILKSICQADVSNENERLLLLGIFQQYLRNENMFCIWNAQRDTPEPFFSNNNYHPKMTMVENGVFSDLGRGNWNSCIGSMIKGMRWTLNPWEVVAKSYLDEIAPEFSDIIKGKSCKMDIGDELREDVELFQGSSSELSQIDSYSQDLIITDPPFGDNVQYAELADFFYVWLRLALKDKYPNNFSLQYSPKALEAVSNKARHGRDQDNFYKKMLSECWKEAYRILKPAGILAFTFHHSEDEPWVAVLESLFEAGFYLEATYPIRSDEIKGENAEFGSKKIEFDIIHVCRKRIENPNEISWAKMRKQIIKDIRELKDILENHQKAGLPEADLEVIRKGKALEYFSKHYGNVYIEKGRTFTVREALIGINQLINDETDKVSAPPPPNSEPITRAFLRIFNRHNEVEKDQLTKYLRGTGTGPSDFVSRGWCYENNKVFYLTSPLEIAKKIIQEEIKKVTFDYDQAMLLIGACYEGSGINVIKILNMDSFNPHPALLEIIEWFIYHGADKEIRESSLKAKNIYNKWESKHQEKKLEQLSLFGMLD